MASKCPRCGGTYPYQKPDAPCSICRRPFNAAPGWSLPEHDAIPEPEIMVSDDPVMLVILPPIVDNC